MLRLVFPRTQGCSRSPVAPARLVQRVSEKTAECGAAWTSPGGPQGMACVRRGSHPGADVSSAWPSLGADRQSRVRGCVVQSLGTQGAFLGSPSTWLFFEASELVGKCQWGLSQADLSSLWACSGLWCFLLVWLFQNVFILFSANGSSLKPPLGIACLKGRYSQKLDTGADKRPGIFRERVSMTQFLWAPSMDHQF